MKSLKYILGTLLIVSGMSLMCFSIMLFVQITDWMMRLSIIGLFALSSMLVFGGVEAIRGGNIKAFFRDLIDAVIHSR